MESLVGKQLGMYQIVAALGQGGMATVYKAYQLGPLNRLVAVKVLPRELAAEPEFVGRFQQEATILAKLQHPRILPIFDFGEADDYTYVVMPLIEGGPLTNLMNGQPVPLNQLRTIISQIAEGLGYAHERGLVHRDVKPSNVLLDASGNCLLSDFGITKILESTKKFTATGGVIGTPAYMAPEQGRGDPVDRRSDLYSLGVILYEMATGRAPYEAETPLAVIFKHIRDPLPLPRDLNPDLPERVEQVIFKALAKQPADRFQTAAEFIEAIKTALPEVGSLPRSPSTEASRVEGQPQPLAPTLTPIHLTPAAPAATTQPAKPRPTQPAEPPPTVSTPTKATQWYWLVGGLLALLVCLGLGLALVSWLAYTQFTLAQTNAQTAIAANVNLTANALVLALTERSTPVATETPIPASTASPEPSATALPPASTITRTAVPSPSTTRAQVIPQSTSTAGAGADATRAPVLGVCTIQASGVFAQLAVEHRSGLGCPRAAEAHTLNVSEQRFQNGQMFWRGDVDAFLVLYGTTSGTWTGYPGNYNQESGVTNCPQEAPAGLAKPMSGFGNVWCGLGGVNATIGWGLDREYGFSPGQGPLIQDFETGVIFRDSDGAQRNLAYVFLNTGRFVRVAP